MRKIHFSFVAMMLVVALFAFGGCGGDDPAPKPKQEIKLSLDSDADGYPDVFDDYPLDATRWNWGTNAEDVDALLGAHNTQETAVKASSPMKAPFSIIGKMKSPDVTKDIADIDHYAFELVGNRQYSVVLYDITGILHKTYLGAGPSFIPAVNVIAKGSSEPLPLTVNTSSATDSSVVLSFTPQRSGTYYFSIANTEGTAQPGEDYTYAFDFVEDKEGDGQSMYFVATGDDGKPFKYSFNDVHFLRTSLLPSVTERDENGFPTNYNPVSADILWKQAVDVVNAEYVLNGLSDVKITEFDEDGSIVKTVDLTELSTAKPMINEDITELAASIAGIRWRDEYFGAADADIWAIDAVTGMDPAYQEAPIEDFRVPVDTTLPIKTETTVKYISSTNDQEQEEFVGTNASIGVSGLSVGISSEYKRNIKYSQTATTIIVKYVVKEESARKLKNSAYKITEDGMDIFTNQGADAFRERWGDYFVAGFRRGASYTATISVATSSVEELEEVKRALNFGVSSSSNDIKIGINKIKTMKDSGKDIETNVEIQTHGGVTPSGKVSLENIVDMMDEFAKGVTPQNMGKIEAVLLHYSQTVNGLRIPRKINVNINLFLEVRKMMNALTTLTATSDTIGNIPKKYLRDKIGGPTEDMVNNFSNSRTKFMGQLRQISASIDETKKWTNDFIAMRNEYRVFLERYAFFQNIMKARYNMPSNTGAGKLIRQGGYDSYSLSSNVNADIDNHYPYDTTYETNGVPARSHQKHFGWDAGANRRVVFAYVNSEHDGFNFLDLKFPSVGRQDLFYQGNGHQALSVKWHFKAKGINIGNNWIKYPFDWDYYTNK